MKLNSPVVTQCVEVQIPVKWGFIAGCWYGDQQTRPLLALHGWQDNAGSFARLAPQIAPYMPILAIDFPGHGRSSHYPPGIRYHTLDYVRLVRYILNYYNWERVSIMAHSMGAAVAYTFAALFPGLIDMFIAIDVFKTRYFEPPFQISIYQYIHEKALVTDERLADESANKNVPLYSFDELEKLLHKGSEYSVNLENCKYILERSVTRSETEADKFYLHRDGRIKFIVEFTTETQMAVAMAQRIKNVHFLMVRAKDSYHFGGNSNIFVRTLSKNNKYVKLHEIANATHHLHLNQPEEVAACIIPFVKTFRKIEKTKRIPHSKM